MDGTSTQWNIVEGGYDGKPDLGFSSACRFLLPAGSGPASTPGFGHHGVRAGRSAHTAGAKRELDIVGRALNSSRLADFNFVIEGHADPRGSAERNLRLSEGRASAVREYLVQNQSVREDRL